jgi:hypothetical protein
VSGINWRVGRSWGWARRGTDAVNRKQKTQSKKGKR